MLCDVKIFLTYLDGVRKTLKWKFRCSPHKWAYIYVPRAYMLRPTEKYFRTSIYVYHQSVYTAECILHIHISWGWYKYWNKEYSIIKARIQPIKKAKIYVKLGLKDFIFMTTTYTQHTPWLIDPPLVHVVREFNNDIIDKKNRAVLMLYCWFQPQKREKFTFIHIKHHYLSHTFIMWWSSSKLESKFDRAISGGNGGIWSLNSNPLHVRIINRRDASLKLINFASKISIFIRYFIRVQTKSSDEQHHRHLRLLSGWWWIWYLLPPSVRRPV